MPNAERGKKGVQLVGEVRNFAAVSDSDFQKMRKELVQLDTPKHMSFVSGEVVEGVLIEIIMDLVTDPVSKMQKRCSRYYVRQEDGTVVTFLGTHVLSSTLRPDHKGRYVYIECTGEDAGIERHGKKMKTFRIFASPAPGPRR
jgi:hypothetical protein